MSTAAAQTNPKLDLVLERLVDAPRELVWAAWTEPQHVKKWFTPAPWSTAECEIDLRPGGIFRTIMRSPEGQDYTAEGCYLEVVPLDRLVWTSALRAGYRPAVKGAVMEGCEELSFTAVITMEAQGSKTKYKAVVMHGDEASCSKHEAMGFYDGWGKTLDQLVALVETM